MTHEIFKFIQFENEKLNEIFYLMIMIQYFTFEYICSMIKLLPFKIIKPINSITIQKSPSCNFIIFL